MKKIMKLFVVLGLLVLFAVPTVVSANDSISVFVNGYDIDFDVPPQAINGRTMVPLRAIFEELGAFVEWDNDTQTVTATKDDTVVRATIGSPVMYINGEEKVMDVVPVAVNGRTLVPARFVAEAFGCEVRWNGEGRTVEINSQDGIFTGIYVIASKLDLAYVLDVEEWAEDNGANVHLWEKVVDPHAQLFEVRCLGNGAYWILNLVSGKAIDAEWGGIESNTNVWQYEINDEPSQMWLIEPAGDGSYHIINYESGLYLDVDNAVAENGTNVKLFERNELYDAQNWYFIEQ